MNTYGKKFAVTLAGESRGPAITVIIDGVEPGMKFDTARIDGLLSSRRPDGVYSTARIEKDEYTVLSGVYNGFTTGEPVTVTVPNSDTDGEAPDCLRPGHADYVSLVRSGGYADIRGGGHFSGRVTVGLCIAGAIALQMLEKRGITVGTEITSVGGGGGCGLTDEMKEVILAAKADGDSVGGTVLTVIKGFPAGCGSPFFDGLESVISHAVFSVPGVKGIEFGDGAAFGAMKGSEANDCYRIEDGRIVTATNHSGGINGGLSNGNEIVFSTTVKAPSTVAKAQKTVNYRTMTEEEVSFGGRNDPCIVQRVCPCITSAAAIALINCL